MLCSNIDPCFVFIVFEWLPIPIRILTEEQTAAEFLKKFSVLFLKCHEYSCNRSFVAQLASAFDC